jgi:hypothetical protein
VKEILVRTGSVFSGTLIVCMIQCISQEHVAFARQQDSPITLPEGSPIPADYGLTAGGIYRHKSCIIPIPPNGRLWPDSIVRDEKGNELKNLQQPCEHPAYRKHSGNAANGAGAAGAANGAAIAGTSGYVSFAYQYVPSGYGVWTEIVTQMAVPPPPTSPTANISYWTGLAPGNANNLVLQPELVWGSFAYNSPGRTPNNQYQILVGAQFSPGGGGYYVCSGGGSIFGIPGANLPDQQGGCGMTSVNQSDNIQFAIGLYEIVPSQCGNEQTDTGVQYVCGDWAWYLMYAEDTTTGQSQSLLVGQVFDSGPDAYPNGGLFTLAYPAVYESDNDNTCEGGAWFNVSSLEASNSSSNYNSVAYNPSTCPSSNPGCKGLTMGNPGCSDGVAVSGGLTVVY